MNNVYFAVEDPLLLVISVVSLVTLLEIWFEGVIIAGSTHSGTSSSFTCFNIYIVFTF